MKNIFIIMAASICLTSCGTEENIRKGESLITDSSNRLPGVIPNTHNVYKGLLVEYDLDKFDKLYREEIDQPDSLKLDYNSNVKILGFTLLMSKGLVEKGTIEQKKYYIDQQIGLDYTVPDSENFYTLLSSCKDYISNDELSIIEKKYFSKATKNLKVFKHKENISIKNEGMIKLKKCHKDFESSIALK